MDNARCVLHIRDNRFGIFCHDLALIREAILVAFEFETKNDTTTTAAL